MDAWAPEDISNFRHRLGLSRKAFGEMVGTSGNYIYLLERGDRQAGKSLKILLSMMKKQDVEKNQENETKGGENGNLSGVSDMPQKAKSK